MKEHEGPVTDEQAIAMARSMIMRAREAGEITDELRAARRAYSLVLWEDIDKMTEDEVDAKIASFMEFGA